MDCDTADLENSCFRSEAYRVSCLPSCRSQLRCISSCLYSSLKLALSSIMHSLQKRHSWPPLHATMSSRASPSINQDPFAHFISPVVDEESNLQVDLTAGITNRRRSRSLPPFIPSPKPSQPAIDKAKRRIAKLKKWIERMQMSYFHHSCPNNMTTSPPPAQPKTLEELLPTERGRDVRLKATSRRRADARTPPRKPRAWIPPSDKIWPVTEETEDVGLGISGEDMDRVN